MPPGRRVVVPQRLPVGDPEHLPDQVDPGHLLAHRMLDLQPRVDLQEADRPVLRHQELTRPRAHVPMSANDPKAT